MSAMGRKQTLADERASGRAVAVSAAAAAAELALGGAAGWAVGAALRLRFAIGFRPVLRAGFTLRSGFVAAAAVVVLRPRAMRGMAVGTVRMALTVVTLVAALAVRPAIGLDAVRVETARLLLGLLGSGLEPLQFGGRLDEVLR